MTATMFYSLGAFIPSLQAQFGWARGDISLAVTIMTIGLILSGALVGRLCDHVGAAAVGSISLASYGIAVGVLALTVDSIGGLWIGYFVIAVMGAGSSLHGLERPIAASI